MAGCYTHTRDVMRRQQHDAGSNYLSAVVVVSHRMMVMTSPPPLVSVRVLPPPPPNYLPTYLPRSSSASHFLKSVKADGSYDGSDATASDSGSSVKLPFGSLNRNKAQHHESVVAAPARGWDGSSVVLVGFKHYQPAIDDPLFVAVTQDHDNHNFELGSLAGLSSRDERVNSCDSSDSAVASCILAYNEDLSAFATLNNSNHSIAEDSPRSNQFFSSPSSKSSANSHHHNKFFSPPFEFGHFAGSSHLNQSFPHAIENLFAAASSSSSSSSNSDSLTMDVTDRFERARRFQGDLKRRTSSIQPFPSAFRVLLETGETRSFRYDAETTVNDILAQLQEKLGICVVQHFGFVLRRANEIVFVLPETMRISEFVDWCAANEYECSLRVVFPPKQPEDFLTVDPVAFDYLYIQCTNDVLAGRFETELGVDKAIYLSALHILQFAIASNLSGKLTTRRIDKEFGLERFIPAWVRERGRKGTVEHAVSESLRHLTERQRGAGQNNYKMQYVKLLSLMADYGAHAFPAVLLGFTEEKCSLMLGPNCGISYLPASLTQTKPVFLIRFEHIRCIGLQWSGQTPTNITCSVHHVIKDITPIQFLLPRWLKDSFLFVIRRYRRLLVSTNSEVTVIESTGEPSSTVSSVIAESASSTLPSIGAANRQIGAAANVININNNNISSRTNEQHQLLSAAVVELASQVDKQKSLPPTPSAQLPDTLDSAHLKHAQISSQRSLNLRSNNVKQARQALLQLNLVPAQSEPPQSQPGAVSQSLEPNQQQTTTTTITVEGSATVVVVGSSDGTSEESSMRQNLLLTESSSCPNISELVATAAAESGIGSDMDSPRSHPPPFTVSPPSPTDPLLEMRFDPPPGFGDSEPEEDIGKFVDNPLCFEGKTTPNPTEGDIQCPPPPPRRNRRISPPAISPAASLSTSHSIDDIVISFNMALKGTLGCDEDDSHQQKVKRTWSPMGGAGTVVMACDGNNVVTVSLTDDLPLPPPELNETSTTLDSTLFPPSECAPPPPPPYFPLPIFDENQAHVSSDSGTDETSNEHQSMSPLPPPVLIAINSLPCDQLKSTIQRVLSNANDRSRQLPTVNELIDTQMACTIADSSALRFALSVFGAQDFNCVEGHVCQSEEKGRPEPKLSINMVQLDELSDKLVNACRGLLTSVGHSSKAALLSSSTDAVVEFAETAGFLLDFHQLQLQEQQYNDVCSNVHRMGQLSSGLTHALDAFNCCMQTGMSVVSEQALSCTPGETAINEKLKQLLLNAAWLARSLAVFSSLAIQMKQQDAAGEAPRFDQQQQHQHQHSVNNGDADGDMETITAIL